MLGKRFLQPPSRRKLTRDVRSVRHLVDVVADPAEVRADLTQLGEHPINERTILLGDRRLRARQWPLQRRVDEQPGDTQTPGSRPLAQLPQLGRAQPDAQTMRTALTTLAPLTSRVSHRPVPVPAARRRRRSGAPPGTVEASATASPAPPA